jgi:hypothetical protein
MKDCFYKNWLYYGEKKGEYRKGYDIAKLSPTATSPPTSSIKLPPGYFCLFTNRLRNGNMYMPITFPEHKEFSMDRLTSKGLSSLRTNGTQFFLENEDSLVVFQGSPITHAGSSNWFLEAGYTFLGEKNLLVVQDFLLEYSLDANLISRTYLSYTEDFDFKEAAIVGDRIIICSGPNPVHMPSGYQGFSHLHSIPKDGFTENNPENNSRKIDKSDNIVIKDELYLAPVYFDDDVVFATENMIVILSYDMEIKRVIQTDFIPSQPAGGFNSLVYLIKQAESQPILICVDLEGSLFFEAPIDKSIGTIIHPPCISSDNSVYIVGNRATQKFGNTGKLLWTCKYATELAGDIHPLVYETTLTITHNRGLTCINDNGEISITVPIDTNISTPLIHDNKDLYLIGTYDGLFNIVFK